MNFENVSVQKLESFIALVTIERPKKLNALNKSTISELHDAFVALESDDEVRVVLITGSGDKAFVAGADISEFSEFSKEEGTLLAKKGQEILFDFIENFSKPVIAAVNGFALGGGLELAMACHFRLASENAKMGLPEVSLGLIPGYGGTQRLPKLIGKGRAMEMILTGGMISAVLANTYGLVNTVVAQEELISTCISIAKRIIQNAPNSARVAIQAVNAGYKNDMNGFQTEVSLFGSCFGTDDFIEGTTAFLNKRKPNFGAK
ncbi:enoyl-CoA hydratase-related protein [Flavicella sp.]|uniref:enoyl-CoA hydratase/isomerase family protein n=1 Tax=Flavicella sp. TaxID=2957742 RepID=UPI002620707F|nr:enoyl-CoA hydratase-related protein [Flavicella sp.]MDG1806120.1 enoyl-CoA hydratase-related protein [Flavicella sp.]MDG2279173.1 enoyl-CoA hydratase-related protein [Flavicella sp.]